MTDLTLYNGIRFERPTCVVLLFNSLGQILVGRNARGRAAGYLQPVHGGLKAKEGFRAACLRETREEVGLKPDEIAFIVASKTFPFYPFIHLPTDHGERGKRLGIAAYIVQEDAQWDVNSGHNGVPAEFNAAQWIDIRHLPNVVPPHHRAAHNQIVEIFFPVASALSDLFMSAEIYAFQTLAAKVCHSVLQRPRHRRRLTTEEPVFPGTLMSLDCIQSKDFTCDL